MSEELSCGLSMVNRLRVATISVRREAMRKKMEHMVTKKAKALEDLNENATSVCDLREQGDLQLYEYESMSQRIALRHHPRSPHRCQIATLLSLSNNLSSRPHAPLGHQFLRRFLAASCFRNGARSGCLIAFCAIGTR